MFVDIAQLVLKQWNAEDLQPNEAFSSGDIAIEFQSLGIKANIEVLEVFSHLNGFDEGEMDCHCINFWSIDKIKLENQRNSEMVEFADFLIDSFRYGFKVEPDDSVGVYVVYSYDNNEKVADSFSTFFQLYLTDAGKLFAFE